MFTKWWIVFALGEWAGGGTEVKGTAGGREEVLPVTENQAPPRPLGTGCGKTVRASQRTSQGNLPSHEWEVWHWGEV